jgi:ribose/xylose/arabinose/galactoside ABC-type transport system permease subunit
MIGGNPLEPMAPLVAARPPLVVKWLGLAIARARSQGLAAALVALVSLFAWQAPGFATLDNLGDMLRDLSVLGTLAAGETFVLIGGGIDLSVGSVLLLAGIVSDDLIRLQGLSAAATVPVALAVGCVVGAVNGFLVTRLRISAFIVTLATLYIIRVSGSRYTDPTCTTSRRRSSPMTTFCSLARVTCTGFHSRS